MISVADALARLLTLVGPVGVETVPLWQARGRVLAETVTAARAQPPFPASAMDGYAVPDTQVAPGAQFRIIGTAAAGHAYQGRVGTEEAVRILTGAPVPDGAHRVIIQEDVSREGDMITVRENLDEGYHVRPAGGDFQIGDTMEAPRRLSPSDLALLASMNLANVPVRARPVIALIATGDELALPGEHLRDDQIVASNSFGLAAIFEAAGAIPRILPVAKDTVSSLSKALELSQGADLVVTIGGASVGDHDIVANAAEKLGLKRDFYKVAMRPGKPLMAGMIGDAAMVGLPGNPVSSMVCGEIFLKPMINKMLGLSAGARATRKVILSAPLPANGPREHYMRGLLNHDDGTVRAFERQDSSLLSVLSRANALIVRPPGEGPVTIGQPVDVIDL